MLYSIDFFYSINQHFFVHNLADFTPSGIFVTSQAHILWFQNPLVSFLCFSFILFLLPAEKRNYFIKCLPALYKLFTQFVFVYRVSFIQEPAQLCFRSIILLLGFAYLLLRFLNLLLQRFQRVILAIARSPSCSSLQLQADFLGYVLYIVFRHPKRFQNRLLRRCYRMVKSVYSI